MICRPAICRSARSG